MDMGLRVLVVDDDADIRTVLRSTLERHGCDVSEAQDGSSITAAALGCQADIILLDIKMPGPDGFETLRVLQDSGRTRDIPVAMLTALSDMTAIERAIRGGATGYLTKPFSVDHLYRQLEAIIDKARESAGHKLVAYPSVV